MRIIKMVASTLLLTLVFSQIQISSDPLTRSQPLTTSQPQDPSLLPTRQQVPSTQQILVTAQTLCSSDELRTLSGCFTKCSSQEFKGCGEFFPALYNPSFCAYKESNQYQSYTYACQACQNPDVLAVREGACSCDSIRCKKGETCQDGQCVVTVEDPECWNNQPCSSGFFCRNGVCKELPECTSSENCDYGLSCRDGLCQPFINECFSVIDCKQGEICDRGQCEINKNIECMSSSECDQGFDCYNGVCASKCIFNMCPFGTKCEAGQCIQSPVKCQGNEGCGQGYFCLQGLCSDKCALVRCAANTTCSLGKCIPNEPQCQTPVDCKQGYTCVQGSCLDRCVLIRCPGGTTCSLGKCIPEPECEIESDCKQGYYCSSTSQCRDKCELTKCSSGHKCVLGKCVSTASDLCPSKINCPNPRPTERTCPTLYFFRQPESVACGVDQLGKHYGYAVECYACRNNYNVFYYAQNCESIPSFCLESQSVDEECKSAFDCGNYEKCSEGKCVDRCDGIICPQGQQCRMGYCRTNLAPVFIPIQDPCQEVDCGTGYMCIAGKCINLFTSPTFSCRYIRCPASMKCQDGKCYRQITVVDPCSDVYCIATHRCVEGKCVPYPYNSLRSFFNY